MIDKELPISVEISNNAAVIKFTNPKERNPLSISVLNELHRLQNELSQDAEITKIVFTGSEDVFASGADLREIANVTGETAKEYAERGQSLMKKIADSSKLTIAAVNGFCFGGAFDLALSCKIRIASPAAQFCHPGANLGIMTGWGGTQRLPRLIGEAAALEMFLTAKRIYANEALTIGLINQISDNPLTEAVKL